MPGMGFDLNVGFPPGSGNAAGDYWGLDVGGGYAYAAWNDTRRGEQDIYASRLFSRVADRLGLETWKANVQEKLKTLDDVYRFATEQSSIS